MKLTTTEGSLRPDFVLTFTEYTPNSGARPLLKRLCNHGNHSQFFVIVMILIILSTSSAFALRSGRFGAGLFIASNSDPVFRTLISLTNTFALNWQVCAELPSLR
jgi:hypothetical protein